MNFKLIFMSYSFFMNFIKKLVLKTFINKKRAKHFGFTGQYLNLIAESSK